MIRFIATECGSQNDGEAVICGASNSSDAGAPHSLIFVRSRKRLDDGGPYFEIDDETQGFHNVVKKVSLVERCLAIELSTVGMRSIGHKKIVVELACSERQIESLKKGLARVFRDQPDKVLL